MTNWRRLIVRELGAVIALAVVAILLLAFAKLASEVGEGETRGFDTAIMLGLRTPGDTALPIGPAWLSGVLLDFTALGGTAVLALVTLVTATYLLVARKAGVALFLLFAVAGGSLLNLLMKSGFDRARPDLVAHLVKAQSSSFPSGHAMNSAIVYLTLGTLLARAVPQRALKSYVIGVAVLLTLIVGCSRVYLGVHWPTDVIGGWAIGASWAILCWLAELGLRRRYGRASGQAAL